MLAKRRSRIESNMYITRIKKSYRKIWNRSEKHSRSMERFNHTNISNETQQYILYKYIYTNSYIYGISVHVVTGLFVRTIYIFRKKKQQQWQVNSFSYLFKSNWNKPRVCTPYEYLYIVNIHVVIEMHDFNIINLILYICISLYSIQYIHSQ